nr:hypothetical protein [Tanacetum cinerariifolium]
TVVEADEGNLDVSTKRAWTISTEVSIWLKLDISLNSKEMKIHKILFHGSPLLRNTQLMMIL